MLNQFDLNIEMSVIIGRELNNIVIVTSFENL